MSGSWDSANVVVAAALVMMVAMLGSVLIFAIAAARTPRARLMVVLGSALLAAFGVGAVLLSENGD